MNDPHIIHIVFGFVVFAIFALLMHSVRKAIKHEKWVDNHNKKLSIQARDWMHENRDNRSPPKPPATRPRRY